MTRLISPHRAPKLASKCPACRQNPVTWCGDICCDCADRRKNKRSDYNAFFALYRKHGIPIPPHCVEPKQYNGKFTKLIRKV